MNYIIVDLEATCWENDRSTPNEIIEIGAVKLNENPLVIDEFQSFVKPMLNPVLSDFCKKLTSIQQEEVDQASSFVEVVREFQNWIGQDYWICSWGLYDKKQFKHDCELYNLPTEWLRNHISIKHQHGKLLAGRLQSEGKPRRDIKRVERGVGMETTLKMMNIPLEGTHHRGIDDARNITKIFVKLFPELKFE